MVSGTTSASEGVRSSRVGDDVEGVSLRGRMVGSLLPEDPFPAIVRLGGDALGAQAQYSAVRTLSRSLGMDDGSAHSS